MTDQHRVLIIGAASLAGAALAKEMGDTGRSGRVLRIEPSAVIDALPAGFDVACGDAHNIETLSAAADNCDIIAVCPPPLGFETTGEAEQRLVNTVVEAARRNGVRRLCYISSSVVDERYARFTPVKALFDAERVVRESGVPWTILRPSWFMEALPRFVHNNKAHVFGKFRYPWHWVAASDFGRIALAALESPNAVGKSLAVFGPQGFTLPEALERYRLAFDPEIDVKVIPVWKVRLLATVAKKPAIKQVIPLMRFLANSPETGNPDETSKLFGAPKVTLNDWAEEALKRRRESANVSSEGRSGEQDEVSDAEEKSRSEEQNQYPEDNRRENS